MADRKKKRAASPLQKLVGRACDDKGMTPYKLSQLCGWQPRSIYAKLRKPIIHTALERMLAALGAEVRIGKRRIRLRLIEGEVIEA